MKLLYITFIDFGELKSGSSVRPQRMYEAFLQNGYDVYLFEGQQNRRRERTSNVKGLIKKLDEISPDICYIEPPSGPVLNRIDLTLLKILSQRNIPVGVFYRDAHWMSPEWWSLRGIKSVVVKALHRRTLAAFKKYCDIMYFPSNTMKKLFADCPRADILPPGCFAPAVFAPRAVTRNIIYVGGVSLSYGTDMLLDAVRTVNKNGLNCTLTLVCRENESSSLLNGTENEDYIKILHLNGDEIVPEYQKADCAVIPLRKNSYADHCMPIKLFEYISNGLPVITTDCRECSLFIKKYGCGISCDSSAEGLAGAISGFFADEDKIREYSAGALTAANENRWTDRANKLVNDLLSVKKSKQL